VKIKSQKDFYSGLMFMGVGIAFAWGATTYSVGSGARMGPGYFPLVLGVLMAVLGGAITFKALVVETESGDRIGPWAWKPLCYILAANFVFGVLLGGLPGLGIPPMGMVLAIVALTFIAALAGNEFRFREVLILSILLAVGSYLAFVVLLKLQFPVWPSFIAG